MARAPVILVPVLLLGAVAAAGCFGADDAVDAASALDAYSRTPENYLILEEWEREAFSGGVVREFAFTVPNGLRSMDLDNHFRVDGGSTPRVKMTYATPSGGEEPATSFGGTGVNGIEVANPEPGAWTLSVDASASEDPFTLTMWLYGCARGEECRVPEPPQDPEHAH